MRFHYSADITGHLRTAQGLFLPPHEKSAFYSVKKAKKNLALGQELLQLGLRPAQLLYRGVAELWCERTTEGFLAVEQEFDGHLHIPVVAHAVSWRRSVEAAVCFR